MNNFRQTASRSPLAALRRPRGFLFLAASAALGSGSPWLDRLGADPAWLFDTTSIPSPVPAPRSGSDIRSTSYFALRSPLRARWSSTEFVQTLATGHGRWDAWGGTTLAKHSRNARTDAMDLRADPHSAGLFAGTSCQAGPATFRTRFASAPGMWSSQGSMGIDFGSVRMETSASRTSQRSELGISVAEGVLSLPWRDRTDSLGSILGLALGPVQANGAAWTRASASPVHDGIADTGSASGWSLGADVSTPWGCWRGVYAADHASLRTRGAREGRVFHDQDWRSSRGRLDLAWSRGRWSAAWGLRQIGLDIPSGGLDRPFVHWNLVPDDRFSQLTSVLEDRSEHLEGAFSVQETHGSVARTWGDDRIGIRACAGFSLTEFDASVSRTTVSVVGLFPRVSDDVPVDGEGWIAMATAGASLAWSPSLDCTVRLGGTWRQPLAGNWRSRDESANGVSRNTPTGSEASPVAPTGFHEWNIGWMLAF